MYSNIYDFSRGVLVIVGLPDCLPSWSELDDHSCGVLVVVGFPDCLSSWSELDDHSRGVLVVVGFPNGVDGFWMRCADKTFPIHRQNHKTSLLKKNR